MQKNKTSFAIGYVVLACLAILVLFAGCIDLPFPQEDAAISKQLEIRLDECENFKESILRPDVSKASCYLPLIEDNRMAGVCERISHEVMRAYCFGIATGNLSQCDILGNDYLTSRCYVLVAEDFKDVEMCGSPEVTGEDRYECISKVAAATKDISVCSQIINETREMYACISKVAASRKELEMCDREIDDFYARIDCYSEVAISKGDVVICGDIKERNERDECYLEIGKAKDDTSVCMKISSDVSRMRCLIEVAESKQDPTICGLLKDDDRDICYLQFISFKKDKRYLRICDEVKNELNKIICYSNICANMGEGPDKEDCYSSLKDVCGSLKNPDTKAQCYSLFDEAYTPTMSHGFDRISIPGESVKYDGNTLKFSVTNNNEQTIEDIMISVKDNSGVLCTLYESPSLSLASGESTDVGFVCSEKEQFDSFEVGVLVYYVSGVSEIVEQGRIQGTVV